VFLDHRWVLFGAIRNDPNKDPNRLRQPYLEIIDPTNPASVTTLELDKSVVEHTSSHSTVDISVGSGAGHEEGLLTGDSGMPFVSDTSRGVITADVYLYLRDGLRQFESYVFVMDIENVLAKAPSPSGPGQRCIEWKDLSPSAAMFSYSSVDDDPYRIFSRHSYVSGFRYASPIQPLVPEDPKSPRSFFVYDFNPHRETSGSLPGAALEDPDPGTGYRKGASEITREVIGGLSCWRMRFDLPAAEEDIKKCHVALTDGGIILFEVCCLMFCSSELFDTFFDS